jgi:UDP:flavonoid glycosyltransferase YjiC (YdhE family)
VLTTFGSLGDLHPYLAVAVRLKEHGHDPVVATSAAYRERVEALRLGFRPLRPDLPPPDEAPALMRRVMDERRGTGEVIRSWLLPSLRDTYDDTLAAAESADLLVSHPLTYATRIVAEQSGVPWASMMLAPLGFFSAYDPPILPGAPPFWKPRLLPPALVRPLLALPPLVVRSWSRPIRRLRAELGLPPGPDPIFAGTHSPFLVLAAFSPLVAAPQPDWPPQTVVTGFPFHDDPVTSLPPELERFLDDGLPPIVFTLGSSAVMDAGSFYADGAAAAARLGRRAVLLVGREPANRPRDLPDGVLAVDYAPFSRLFPRAAAIVHQGGIGTTGEAMRAGRPMLVVPHAHDQPDNADRVRRLGVARTIPRRRFTAARVEAELRRLLVDPSYAARAAQVAAAVRQENGAGTACAAIDALLRSTTARTTGVRGP